MRFLIFLTLALTLIGCSTAGDQSQSKNLLQICPTEWIQDKMPGLVGDTTTKEYFTLDGTRRELAEFDLAWIKTNCKLQPTEVH